MVLSGGLEAEVAAWRGLALLVLCRQETLAQTLVNFIMRESHRLVLEREAGSCRFLTLVRIFWTQEFRIVHIAIGLLCLLVRQVVSIDLDTWLSFIVLLFY